jgi:hypothetical protein
MAKKKTGTIKMVAKNLDNAVATQECIAHREAQGREAKETKVMLRSIQTSLTGDPGDTSKPGLHGCVIRLSDQQETANTTLDEIKRKVATLELRDYAAMQKDIDGLYVKLRMQREKASRFPWLRICLAVITLQIATLTLAGTIAAVLITRATPPAITAAK